MGFLHRGPGSPMFVEPLLHIAGGSDNLPVPISRILDSNQARHGARLGHSRRIIHTMIVPIVHFSKIRFRMSVPRTSS